MSKFPTIKEVSALIRAIKPDICDEYLDEGDTLTEDSPCPDSDCPSNTGPREGDQS